MDKKALNYILIWSGIGLLSLISILGYIFRPSRMELPMLILSLLSFASILTGIINRFKIPTWLKIILIIFLTPLIYILYFLLMWGFSSGFTYSM